MKNIILKLWFILIVSIVITSCAKQQNHKRKVHVFKAPSSDIPKEKVTNDDWVFWYVIYINNDTYYSYSSSMLLNSASLTKVDWVETEKLPFNQQLAKEEPIEEVNPEDLPEEVNEAISSADNPEEEVATENSETSSESESSNSSSESSSDSGGDGSSD